MKYILKGKDAEQFYNDIRFINFENQNRINTFLKEVDKIELTQKDNGTIVIKFPGKKDQKSS